MKTTILLTVEHSKPIPDLTDIAANRVWLLDGVTGVTASIMNIDPHLNQPMQLGTQSAIDEALKRYAAGKNEQSPPTKFDSLDHLSKIAVAMAGIDPSPWWVDKRPKKPGFWSWLWRTQA